MTTPAQQVLDAMEAIIVAIETGTRPKGLPDEVGRYLFNPDTPQYTRERDRHLNARQVYAMVPLLTGLTEGQVKKQVRDLASTDALVRKGESTATTYTLPRVIEQEQAARVAKDAHLRKTGQRLQGFGVRVIYRFSGYLLDVGDLADVQELLI